MIRRLLRRHPLRVWLLWAVGAAVLALSSLSVADPAILSLALDPELVALIVASGIGWLLDLRPARWPRASRRSARRGTSSS